MATALLDNISKRFFKGVKAHTAEGLGVKTSCFQHFTNGRPIKDWMLVHIRRQFGTSKNKNGLTDKQILDLLEQEYPEDKLKVILNEYS